jgi:outer membrane protein assembly factor BamB
VFRKLIIYAAVIVVAVGVLLFVLAPEDSLTLLSDGARLPAGVPQTPWSASAEHDGEANAGFVVESDRTDLKKLAGTDLPDWPCFNGVDRNNRSAETGLMSEWPSGGPVLIWKVRGLGEGYSAVSVVDGVVYSMGNKGKSECVMAVDVGTGEKLWSTPIGWASQASAGQGPRSTPTVSGTSVFVLGGNGELACLESSSGKIRWKKNILSEYKGTVPTWGICESLLIDQNRIICTPGGSVATMAALDPETGNEIWTSLIPEQDRAAYASPLVVEVGGIRQYVQFLAGGVVSVRTTDGQFLWRENSSANSTANCSSPLAVGDLVFSASNYGTGGALVRMKAEGAAVVAERVYHTSNMKSHHGDMVIVDGLLYGSDDPGILTCLDLETADVRWQNRSVGKSSVTWADGRLYVRSERGPVALVDAIGSEYHERGKFDQPDRSSSSAWSHPVVAHGRMFLRDQDVLLCYDVTAAAP